MPRISYVKPEDATGSVAESYRRIKEHVSPGQVAINTAMFSLKPRLL